MTDVRLGNLIRPGNGGDVTLLGFPYDRGVEINGGRVGAAEGPAHFRAWLKKYGVADNPETGVDLARITVNDAGDVPPGLPLAQAHELLSQKTEAILRAGGIPFVVGGSNDQSYPNAVALLRSVVPDSVGVVNIDAHLDVRPLQDGQAHSGSAFRQLLEDPRFSGTRFIEFAAQGAQCSREHAEYVRTQGGRILWLEEVQHHSNPAAVFRAALGEMSWKCTSLFVSFDLDVVAGAEAPGVSCPGVIGLSTRDAVHIARFAGCHPTVKLFDLSEYNPTIEDEHTGRLAVAIFHAFCHGVAERKLKT
jgi:formiminoglutamase